MNTSVFWWLLVFSIGLAGCGSKTISGVEHKFNLPERIGTLSITLDPELNQIDQWVHRSDYRCGALNIQCRAYSGWPVYKDSSYLNPYPDSLFQFTVRTGLHSIAECDSFISPQEHWANLIKAYRIEGRPTSMRVDGLVQANETFWSCVYSSYSNPEVSETFECYTSKNGTGVVLLWERLVTSKGSFDLSAYARKQLATARFCPP